MYIYTLFYLIFEIWGVGNIILFYRYGVLSFKRWDYRFYYFGLYS